MIKEMQQYKKQIVSLYKEIIRLDKVKQENPHYRIVKMPNEKDKKISFQLINKNLVMQMLPEEIMRSELLIHFNRVEIAVISHLGTKNEFMMEMVNSKNNFKVIKQSFSCGKTRFVLEKENGEVIEREATKLVSDSELINKISGEDAVKIGYTAAEEHYININKLRK